MLNHSLQAQAVVAAKNQAWGKAVKLNQEILKNNPDDTAALNRLGVALIQLKKNQAAKKAFQKALKIDPKNKIAQKNLAKLKNQKSPTPQLNSNQLFVEEPGKTKIIKLHRLASKEVLESLSPGDCCQLKLKKRYISVEVEGKYVGALPDDVSFRLTKLINTGNKYSCYIQTAGHNLCAVYLKETKQSKRNQGVRSFPNQSIVGGFKFKEIKDEYQEKVPFEVINLDQEDEVKEPKINLESTVIT